MLLGNFQKKAKQPAEAIAAYKRALALDDEHQGALFSLAAGLQGRRAGSTRRASGFERARELDPRNGKVLWQLADLLHAQGRAGSRRRRSSRTRSPARSTSTASC